MVLLSRKKKKTNCPVNPDGFPGNMPTSYSLLLTVFNLTVFRGKLIFDDSCQSPIDTEMCLVG
jgi:hypothetical protein